MLKKLLSWIKKLLSRPSYYNMATKTIKHQDWTIFFPPPKTKSFIIKDLFYNYNCDCQGCKLDKNGKRMGTCFYLRFPNHPITLSKPANFKDEDIMRFEGEGGPAHD